MNGKVLLPGHFANTTRLLLLLLDYAPGCGPPCYAVPYHAHAPHARQRPTHERLGNRPHAGAAGARNPGEELRSGPAGVHRPSPPRRAAGPAPGPQNRIAPTARR